MMLTSLHPEMVSKMISLDSLRYPFSTDKGIPILCFGAIDTNPDEGVIHTTRVDVISIKDAKHIDLCDRGSDLVKDEIQESIIQFLSRYIMKKIVLFLYGVILSGNIVCASQCFIAKEKDHMIHKEGDCDKRYASCSTFKIPLSLIGFDSGILVDEMHPVWPFKEGYVDWQDTWKQDQTPQSWMKESCILSKLAYGNMDLSGDKGQSNGLTNAWLSSSLKISSLEQVAFLDKLFIDAFHISRLRFSANFRWCMGSSVFAAYPL